MHIRSTSLEMASTPSCSAEACVVGDTVTQTASGSVWRRKDLPMLEVKRSLVLRLIVQVVNLMTTNTAPCMGQQCTLQ